IRDAFACRRSNVSDLASRELVIAPGQAGLTFVRHADLSRARVTHALREITRATTRKRLGRPEAKRSYANLCWLTTHYLCATCALLCCAANSQLCEMSRRNLARAGDSIRALTETDSL